MEISNIQDRLTELNIILEHLSQRDYKKIPKEIIEYIEQNQNEKYNWEFDENKTLSEQKIHKDTIALLSYINSEYLVNNDQKILLDKLYELNNNKKG